MNYKLIVKDYHVVMGFQKIRTIEPAKFEQHRAEMSRGMVCTVVGKCFVTTIK